MAPGPSKQGQSVINRDDKSARKQKNASTFNVGNTEQSPRSKRAKQNSSHTNPGCLNTNESTSSRPVGEKQSLAAHQDRVQKSMPIIEVDQVIIANEQVRPKSVTEERPSCINTHPNISHKPYPTEPGFQRPIPIIVHENRLLTADSDNGHDTHVSSVAKTVPKPPKKADQSSQLFQDTLQLLAMRSDLHSNSQLKGIDAGRPAAVSIYDQGPRPHAFTYNTPSTSYEAPTPVQRNYQAMENILLLHSLRSNQNISTAVRESSKSTKQSTLSSLPSVEREAVQVTQNQVQGVLQEPGWYVGSHIAGNSTDPRLFLQNNPNNSQDARRASEIIMRSHGNNHTAHWSCRQSVANNTCAAQNLSDLAHRASNYVEQSHERHHFPTQKPVLQQSQQTRVQNFPSRPEEAQMIDQLAAFQNSLMKTTLDIQSQTLPVYQPRQSLPQHEHQSPPYHLQQMRLMQEQIMRLTKIPDIDHIPNCRISKPFAVPNLVNNNSDVKHPELRKNLLNNQDSQSDPRALGKHFDSSIAAKKPEPLGYTERTLPAVTPELSNLLRQSHLTTERSYSLRDPRVQAKQNERLTEVHDIHRGALRESTIVNPVSQNFEIQATTSSNMSHAAQYQPVNDNQVYQLPRTLKTAIDQSTQTDFITKRVNDRAKTVKSVKTSRKMDRACQVDELMEVASDHVDFNNHEIVSDHEVGIHHAMSTEEAPAEMINNADGTEESVLPESNTVDTPTAAKKSRIIVEQEMLNVFGTLFTQMGATLARTCDMFNNLRTSIRESTEIYQRLVEAVEKFNSTFDTTTEDINKRN